MKLAGRVREERVLRSERAESLYGGSETRPTCRMRMKKVEKKKAAGEVVKREMRTRKTAVTAKVGQRESRGHFACVPVSERNLNDLGKDAAKLVLSMPCALLEGKCCWVPVRKATPHPPASLVITPA